MFVIPKTYEQGICCDVASASGTTVHRDSSTWDDKSNCDLGPSAAESATNCTRPMSYNLCI